MTHIHLHPPTFPSQHDTHTHLHPPTFPSQHDTHPPASTYLPIPPSHTHTHMCIHLPAHPTMTHPSASTYLPIPTWHTHLHLPSCPSHHDTHPSASTYLPIPTWHTHLHLPSCPSHHDTHPSASTYLPIPISHTHTCIHLPTHPTITQTCIYIPPIQSKHKYIQPLFNHSLSPSRTSPTKSPHHFPTPTWETHHSRGGLWRKGQRDGEGLRCVAAWPLAPGHRSAWPWQPRCGWCWSQQRPSECLENDLRSVPASRLLFALHGLSWLVGHGLPYGPNCAEKQHH